MKEIATVSDYISIILACLAILSCCISPFYFS
jgi:hypothetical protein